MDYVFQMPRRKKKENDEDGGASDEKSEYDKADKVVKASFDSAYRMAATFLGGFLQK